MAYVSVHYGPYEAHGVVRHRTQRLRGLKERLEMAGHTVELIPSPHWDRCVIEIGRRNIFRCRLTNLDYYTDGIDDVVCRRAIQAVDDAIVRMRPEFLYPDVTLFSADFFEETINEAFRLLNVREYICKCVHDVVAHVAALECINILLDESMIGNYVRDLMADTMERAFLKDYMKEMLETDLEDILQAKDHLARAMDSEIDNRQYMKDVIMNTILHTHLYIRDFIKNFVDTTIKEIVEEIEQVDEGIHDHVVSRLTEKLSSMEHLSIKKGLSDWSSQSMRSSQLGESEVDVKRPNPSYSSSDVSERSG